MYEIPFVSRDILNQADDQRARWQTTRMKEVIAVADKLTDAGWPIEWTITGLAFSLPYEIKYGPESGRTPTAIRQTLISMGIPEEVRPCSSRSLLEVVTAKSEYADRVQYAEEDQAVRSFACIDGPNWEDQEIIRESVEAMMALEDLYSRKELTTEDSYRRGTVKGRKQALDWLFGEEWPELEPEDECEAEEVEECRAYERQEQAIDGLHQILFGRPEATAAEQELRGPQEPVIAAKPAVTMDEDSKKRFVAEIIARHLNAPTPGKSESPQPSAN